MLWKTGALKGLRVVAKNVDAGKIEQFLFDDQRWTIRYIVIDFEGKHHFIRKLLSPLAVHALSSTALQVKVSAEQLQNSPDIDTALPVSRQMEEMLHSYYSWPCYWLFPEGYNLLGGALYPGLSVPYAYPGAGGGYECVDMHPAEKHMENTPASSHLRLTNEVIGYKVLTTDGEAGQVNELLISDDKWYIKYLVVDTGHLFPGRKVLIPFQMVSSIEWTSTSVMVDLDTKTIIESPLYNQAYAVTGEYEARILGYYYPENRK